MSHMSKYIRLIRDFSFSGACVHEYKLFSPSESGSEYSGGVENEEEYDELDHREDGQFWSTNDDPVERAESPEYEPYQSDDERPTPPPVISLFAIGKLCR